jgi:hypothetical protein
MPAVSASNVNVLCDDEASGNRAVQPVAAGSSASTPIALTAISTIATRQVAVDGRIAIRIAVATTTTTAASKVTIAVAALATVWRNCCARSAAGAGIVFAIRTRLANSTSVAASAVA